jgi:hypothetical protein
MSQPHLLFVGACARVVDEDRDADPNEANALRSLPRSNAEKIASVPVGSQIQVLDGPRLDRPPKKETAWWAVRVLDGDHSDWLGWMAEIEPGTSYYNLREIGCLEGRAP